MKRNIGIVLEYDGTRYDGWQRQGNTANTIQGRIEAVLAKWAGEEVEIAGSGRTDAGVHAKRQTANFRLEESVCPQAGMAADYLNQYLPEDIRVTDAFFAPERFHSRLSAVRKTYAYYVETAKKKDVFERKYVYGLGRDADLLRMERAAALLMGEHDFKSFCGNKKMKKSTVRRIDEIKISRQGTKIVFTFVGNGFLYHMVRILVGTLLEVGLGTREPEEMEAVLAARDRAAAGATAPPEGLFLMDVEYARQKV